jgi:hypothetical protein
MKVSEEKPKWKLYEQLVRLTAMTPAGSTPTSKMGASFGFGAPETTPTQKVFSACA